MVKDNLDEKLRVLLAVLPQPVRDGTIKRIKQTLAEADYEEVLEWLTKEEV